ncbi:MAG: hypothetical protein FJ044_05120 [Candidatus Cloacimonetes bacterium]|nr:hypothetical protein [Candidatus Cloacimonadota bacterium]
MHKEIEAIKSKLSAEMEEFGWQEYRRRKDAAISTILKARGHGLIPASRPGISVLKKIDDF